MSTPNAVLFFQPVARYASGRTLEGPKTADKREAYEWAMMAMIAVAGPFGKIVPQKIIEAKLFIFLRSVTVEVYAKKLGDYDNPLRWSHRETVFDGERFDPIGRSWLLWAAQAVAEDREEARASRSSQKDTLIPPSFGKWILKKKGGDLNEAD